VTGYALVKSNIYLLLFLLLVAVVAAVNHSLRYKEFILKKRIQGENMALQGYQTRLKRAYERMESLAVIDPLTRVFNRAYLMQWLTSGVYQDKEASAFFSMIMYDLDRFKEINDIGGHQAGDQALQKLTEIVREEIEGGNMTFRYGGDEFCIVLPGWDLVRAVKTAEKIRQRIEKHPDMQVKFRTGETVQLTVSMGVTTEYILATIDPDFLIRWLDAALFESKRKGRNRVHVFDPVDRKIYDASEWSQRSEPKERT